MFVLAKKLGEVIPVNCQKCGSNNDIHVNDVKAEENKLVSLFAEFIFLAGTLAFLFF